MTTCTLYSCEDIFIIMDLQKTRYPPSLKETLNSREQQAKQNRQKREEYEKTVKLLRPVNKNKEFRVS
jgi:hypothetical protein